jgi:hypothetical protein
LSFAPIPARQTKEVGVITETVKLIRRLCLVPRASFAVHVESEDSFVVDGVAIVWWRWVWAERECTADTAVSTTIELAEDYFGRPFNPFVIQAAVTRAIWELRNDGLVTV